MGRSDKIFVKMDAPGQRFTKGDDLFTIFSHTHCFASHTLVQKIRIPLVYREYPHWKDFSDEIDKGYPIVGISAHPVHLDRVLEICRYVRKRSPDSIILLGSYAGMAFSASFEEAEQKKYVVHVVKGEGVKFLRGLLGEETNRPIRQSLMPKAGGAPAFISEHLTRCVGFLVSGLGCVGGCDFCTTPALFSKKWVQLLSPEPLVDSIVLYHEHFPEVCQVFVIEEDHFRYPNYLMRMKEYWEEYPKVVESLDWFGFGSIDQIGTFAQRYGWEAIVEIGIGAIFIGVESKFAGEHGYKKRAEIDAREVFQRLHSMGIRTVGAWMCGWDFHTHATIHEDLNCLVSLHPTYQQLTRVSPFPGTELWKRLREQDRVMDVSWEGVHFWSGAQKNIALEAHETLNLTEYGYDLLYQTWGPSILRRLDVTLNGYAYSTQSKNPVVRKHRRLLYKRNAAMLWGLLRAMDRFAPNGVVRCRVRKVDEKYRAVVGEPTAVMEVQSRALDAASIALKAKSWMDPLNRHPKEEPFKRLSWVRRRGENAASLPWHG